jgi:NTP pyrophosphatase (non-canonical NTP hydrolase)
MHETECGNCGVPFGQPSTFLQDLRAANVKRAPDFRAGDLRDWSPAERGNELAGEVGELLAEVLLAKSTGKLCNVLKKLLRYGKQHDEDAAVPLDILASIADELADVFICADLIGAQLDIDAEAAIRRKFNATSTKIGSKVLL